METRHLDIGDDAQVARYHEILWRAEKDDGRPWNAMWSLEELAGLLREPTPEMRTEAVTAWDAGEMAGAAFLMLGLLDNTDKAFVFVAVEPELRRRGIGSALVQAVVDAAVAARRTTLTGIAACAFEERESAAQMRFAHKHGFEVAFTEIQRSLRLPVPAQRLDELERRNAPFVEGYEVVSFVGQLPEDVLESYCALCNQLVLDAPTGDLEFEQEALTPEIETARRARDARSGRTVLTALALHGDEVVAYTDLVVPRDADQCNQRGTFVARRHRGHRLGAAVKLANLRRLQELFPDAGSVETTNAEVNEHMVGINEQLGYVPVAVMPNFVRVLG